MYSNLYTLQKGRILRKLCEEDMIQDDPRVPEYLNKCKVMDFIASKSFMELNLPKNRMPEKCILSGLDDVR